MSLPKPRFISINQACSELKTSKEIIVYNVLSGVLPVYAYGLSAFKLQLDNGAGIIEYMPEVGQEPDQLSNPRKHYKNPELDAVILATYPTVVHMGLNGDSDLVQEVPAAEYPFDIDALYFLTADVLALMDEAPIPTETVHGKPAPAHVETDTQRCDRMKAQGLDDKTIAKELKRAFPVLTPHKIGKMITSVTGVTVTPDAYRKRGIRLLK